MKLEESKIRIHTKKERARDRDSDVKIEDGSKQRAWMSVSSRKGAGVKVLLMIDSPVYNVLCV